jgi:Trypsin-like peptidase domain
MRENERECIIDFGAGNFVAVLDMGRLTRSIMPLIHLKEELARPIGTCFCIANDGLYLTARHVIEEAFPDSVRDGRLNTEDDGWLHALYVSDEPSEEHPGQCVGGFLPVHKIHFNGVLDMAAVQLTMPMNTHTNTPLILPANKLGLGLPKPSEMCFAFGYHSMAWDRMGPDFSARQKFYCSRGDVEEVHLPSRDSVIAPFPCFRTSARYDPGMSGGPVMSEDGLIRGVICSSYDGLTDEDGYISYVSLIGPAALLQVERLDESGVIRKYFVGDLIGRGIVHADTAGVVLERKSPKLKLYIGGGIINSFLE